MFFTIVYWLLRRLIAPRLRKLGRTTSRSSSLRVRRKPAGRDLERLNTALAAYPVQFRLSGHGTQPELDVVPLDGRGSRVISGEIALSAARFLAQGELDRLKMCDNAGCRWVFHDETKNRSRRWCGPCGNLDKVRRFRERQRLEHDGRRPDEGATSAERRPS